MNSIRFPRSKRGWLVMALMALTLGSCGSPTETSALLIMPGGIRNDHTDYLPETDPPSSLAQVESIEVQVWDSSPLQAQVQVKGYLSSGCEQFNTSQIQFQADRFVVLLSTTQTQAVCTMQLQAFEQMIPLDITGLPAGRYEVEVNGLSTQFELTEDR